MTAGQKGGRFGGTVLRLGALAVLALIVTACAEPTPYAPQPPGGGPGYTDQRLAENRYRVVFRGNSVTDRITVENYLLRRAAEVTLAAGYTAFMFDTRDTKARTTYYSDFAGWPGWPGYGWYWHSWPYYGPFDGPFGYDTQVQTRPITRYEAYAEIVMLTAAQAATEPRAMKAQDVLSHLAPPPPPPPGQPPPPPPGASPKPM